MSEEPGISEVVRILHELKEDLEEVRRQTTKTNGRVTELEFQERLRSALEGEKSAILGHAALEQHEVTEHKEKTSQWRTMAVIAALGVGTAILSTVLSLLFH